MPVSILLAFGITSLTFLQPLLISAIFEQKDFAYVNGLSTVGCNLGIAVGSPIWSAVFGVSKSYYTGVMVIPLRLPGSFWTLLYVIRKQKPRVIR